MPCGETHRQGPDGLSDTRASRLFTASTPPADRELLARQETGSEEER